MILQHIIKHSLCFIVALFFTACHGNSVNTENDSNESAQTEETEEIPAALATEEDPSVEIYEDEYYAKEEGKKDGLEDGYNDGFNYGLRGMSYDDGNSYQTDDAINAYKNGYDEGYAEGFSKWEEEEEERLEIEEEKERQRDWHNWEMIPVDGLYILLEDVDDDAIADYVARERYEGEYIRDNWNYYAKISHSSGEYEITIGNRINSYLYKVQGSDVYIHFKYSSPSVRYGNEGVLKWSGPYSSYFYKKPSNLY